MLTIDDLLRSGKVNCNLAAYQRKRDEAMRCCMEMLQTHAAPYIALSGGKDSVAMAFLVADAARRTGKSCRLWLHLSDASFPGTLETCQQVSRQAGLELDVFQPEESAFVYVRRERKQAFGKSGVFFDSVRAYAADKDLAFVGVRGYESKRRMQAARKHGMVFHSASMGNVDVVNPLQWFRLVDVFSLLCEYQAPIHPIYYKFPVETRCNANGEPKFIRLGYVTAKDLLEKGTVVFLRANYPGLYNKLIEAFPEASRYT